MNASSGEPWSEDISDLTNEIAHGRTVAEVSFAGLPRECFVRNDRGRAANVSSGTRAISRRWTARG